MFSSGLELVVGCREDGNEHLGSVKTGRISFLDQKHKLFSSDPAPWN
jgi:hypothetical protein